MEHVLERTEMLLDVSLDDLHLLLGVDLGNAGRFVLRAFSVRVTVPMTAQEIFQSHLLLRQSQRQGCG